MVVLDSIRLLPQCRGHNSIWMYQKQPDGTLELLDEVKSPREHDGPRHCVPSPDGKFLYSVSLQWTPGICGVKD